MRIISPPPRTLPLGRKLRSWLNGDGWQNGLPARGSHADGSDVDHQVLDRWRPVSDDDVPDGDIVIATWWETAEWVNALSKKGVKVYFIQGHEIFSHLPVDRCKATYRLPMHKIVVSRWLEDVMATLYGDEKVDLVPNSVDHSQFFSAIREKQSIPTVGLLYSQGHIKGLDVSLSALRIVGKMIPLLRILSFGNQPMNERLLLPKDARFYICPPQQEIRNIYSQCDVWLTASRSEGFNLPAMEAMACRTPVVATRTGWPEEAVKTGANGVLVDVDDWIGLANGVEWVLSRSGEDWRKLSSNAYATVASSSWQKSTAMFEEALKHACRRSSGGEIAGTYSYL